MYFLGWSLPKKRLVTQVVTQQMFMLPLYGQEVVVTCVHY